MELETNVTNSRNESYALIDFVPFVERNGQILRIKSIKFKLNKTPMPFSEKDFVSIEEQERMLAESSGDSPEEQSWDMPVLDGSGSSSEEVVGASGISPEDLAKCQGWDEATIQSYLDQGWTIDQLAEYYAEQLE